MVRTVGIVSLSSGLIGEDCMKRALKTGIGRLRDYGLTVKFLPHALKGERYVGTHPEDRAADLLRAFRDPEIDMILCAFGGDDTYRLLPYLFEHDELREAVSDKIFLGFSDTTFNHFMLHKVGLRTFYGQAFLDDICMPDREMLPYTRKYFEELIRTGGIRAVTPSDVWYESAPECYAGKTVSMPACHPDRGFEALQGNGVFSGRILGGCIDSIFDMFDTGRYEDAPVLSERYGLFPEPEDWRGKILLLESSEEKMPPEKYRMVLETLRKTGVFEAVAGVLVGKPMDEAYQRAYHRALVEVIDNPALPVVCNLNIGHAMPRCIIPFGAEASVDAERQIIRFTEPISDTGRTNLYDSGNPD